MFQNNDWNFFKLYETALIIASERHNTKIVKILVEQQGIDDTRKIVKS